MGDFMNGLVLQGGGAKGSYHIGVWKALRELNIEIHAVTGTSIGALNGVMIAQGKFDEVYDLWYNIEPSNLFNIESKLYKKFLEFEMDSDSFSIYFKYLVKMFKEGGLDISPLKELIDRMVDEDLVRKSEIDFGLVTVDLTDLEPHELFVKDIPEGKLNQYLLGSSHLPIFKMDKVDGKILLDGMFYDNQPVRLMLEKTGIDTLIIVENKGIGIHHKADLSEINTFRIKPSGDLGKTLDLTKDQARTNLQMGYFDTLRVFNGYCGSKYYIQDFNEESILESIYHLDFDRINTVAEILGLKAITSRREIFEKVIPEIAKMLKIPDEDDYKSLFVTVLETVAEYFSIERYRVYEINELIEIVKSVLLKDEEKVINENRRFIKKILKQGNIIIGNLKNEVVVEVMAAILIDKRSL